VTGFSSVPEDSCGLRLHHLSVWHIPQRNLQIWILAWWSRWDLMNLRTSPSPDRITFWPRIHFIVSKSSVAHLLLSFKISKRIKYWVCFFLCFSGIAKSTLLIKNNCMFLARDSRSDTCYDKRCSYYVVWHLSWISTHDWICGRCIHFSVNSYQMHRSNNMRGGSGQGMGIWDLIWIISVSFDLGQGLIFSETSGFFLPCLPHSRP